jgi:hypothetical protein
MDTTLKVARDSTTAPNIDKIVDDIAALRRDISALTGHLKSSAVTGASEAIDELGGKAKQVYGNLADQGGRTAKALGDQVKEQPLLSLLAAFLVGLVSSRFLSR